MRLCVTLIFIAVKGILGKTLSGEHPLAEIKSL